MNASTKEVEVKYDSEKQIITTTEKATTTKGNHVNFALYFDDISHRIIISTVPIPDMLKSIVSSDASIKSRILKKAIHMSDDEEEEMELDDGSLYSAASQSDEEEESDLVSLADSDESSPLGKRRLGNSRNSNKTKKTARVRSNNRSVIAPKRSSQLVLSDDESSDRASPVGVAIANKPSKTAPDSTNKKVKISPPEQGSK